MSSSKHDAPRPLSAAVITAALVVIVAVIESVVAPAITSIQAEMSLDPGRASLIVSTLIVSAAVATPVVGRFADRVGGRLALGWTSIIVSIGGFLAAFGQSFEVFLVGQLLLGVGVGIVPLAFVIVRESVIGNRRGVATGFVMALTTIGGVVGVLLGGFGITDFGRAWVFGAPAATVAVLASAAFLLVPRRASVVDAKALDGAFDWAGTLMFAAALGCVVLALSFVGTVDWTSLSILGLAAGAVVLVVAWLLVERRAANPFVDLDLLAQRPVWSTTVAAVLQGISYGVLWFLLPQLIVLPAASGYGLGGTPADITLFLLPMGVVGVLAGPIAGSLTRRAGARTIALIGLAMIAAAAFYLLFRSTAHVDFFVAYALAGVGLTVFQTALTTAVIEAVAPESVGIATGLFGVGRIVGAGLGAGIGGAVLASALDSAAGVPSQAGFVIGFLISLGIAVVGGIWTAATVRRSTTERTEPTEAVPDEMAR
ncbi:MFS transporter [Rhodococcus fascians]|nr:MFS transporter [Rhodococcus fascians]MBY4238007.1 MFS transporter [Rhodococcus fascians]MBY4253242.1 MFS transporter [Rhodococcus fascians]MBY4268879.1 MFS transporter [Rhodococcus fascians]